MTVWLVKFVKLSPPSPQGLGVIKNNNNMMFITLIVMKHVSNYYLYVDHLIPPIRLLLGPFKVGAVAFSWAAGKLEPNRIGLPTSPSSTDVQSRVQQAVAKHESQPSDREEAQESSQDLSVSANEIAGPSES